MLQIEGASIAYGHDILFSNFNLQLRRGEIACISGSSGCGKTSLLNAILGFTPLKEGRITVNNIVSDKKICKDNFILSESQSSHTVLRNATIQLL